MIHIEAPAFPPVRDRKTGKLKPVNPWLNSNQRLHPQAKAKLSRAWRDAASAVARDHSPVDTPVRILAHIWKPHGGRWDPANWYPTAKACVDGFVDAGILADDDWTLVVGPDMRRGGKGPDAIVFTFEPVTPAD